MFRASLIKGRINPILILLIILISCIASDIYIANSFLTIPLIISTLASGLLTELIRPKLKSLKLNQIIRREGPAKHYQKSGTPTMGGLSYVTVGVIIGNIITYNNDSSHKILSITSLTLGYMLIGLLDDWESHNNNTNVGLSGKSKLFLQALIGTIFILYANSQSWINADVSLFLSNSINLGILILPLALFVILAESNATNLTDGLDGLASGCGSLVFAGLGFQLMLRGSDGDPAIAGFCISMSGALIGFLFHNCNPAKIFMGDTGSLALGGGLAGVGLLSNSLWPLLIMGGVFAAEAISVIIQVSWFKTSKKLLGKGQRVFLMTPIHHHFELQGFSEDSIVVNFWIINILLIILGIILLPTS